MAKKYGDELDTDGDTDMDLVFTADDDEKPRGQRVGSTQLVAGTPTRVRVEAPFQVVHAQIVYRPGDLANVPESVAAGWIRDRWVSPAE